MKRPTLEDLKDEDAGGGIGSYYVGEFGRSINDVSRSVHAMRFQMVTEIQRLRALLNGRDDFIVSKGLWQEFCDQLPKSGSKPQ